MSLLGKLFGSREIKDEVQNRPSYAQTNDKFSFIVDDVATVAGRGIVVIGKVISGEICTGNTVNKGGRVNTTVTDIAMSTKMRGYAKEGDKCGILFSDISRKDINIGDKLTKV